jgi:16S rRNA (adenine1518-N6/adenine1519-N6)-dimethyltransferase
VEAAELVPHEPVWEIGPGKGVLTQRILSYTDDLTAFEIDNRLIASLTTTFNDRINLVNRDILGINWQELLLSQTTKTGTKIKLISNLPYQITSPVLYALEKHAGYFSRIVLMLQKEVAERLTAKAGTKAYGVMTLKLGYQFTMTPLFPVPPTAFAPPPKVQSAVIMLTPRIDKPIIQSLEIYRQIIDRAFAQRRKTLRNNLKTWYGNKLEETCGIDFTRRGETLSEAEFVHLADCALRLSVAAGSAKQ